MAGIKKINAVFIYISDMKKMREFYAKTLGLQEPSVESEMWVEYKLSGSNLALHQGDPRIMAERDPRKTGVKFSFEVDDIESYCRELKDKGVEFSIAPRADFGSTLAEIKDPEGNLIRLIQYN